jgi:hypothetical protein
VPGGTDTSPEQLLEAIRVVASGEAFSHPPSPGGTAKTHVSRLLVKLSARDRAQLVVVAYETGLGRPGLFADGGGPHQP